MEPTTEAGRALLRWADELRPFLSDERVLSPASVAIVEDGIERIENEAVTRVLDALAGEVRALRRTKLKHKADHPESSYDPLLRETTVFALIKAHRPKGGPDGWTKTTGSSEGAGTTAHQPKTTTTTRSPDVQATIDELARGALDNWTKLRDNGWLMAPMPNEAEVRVALSERPKGGPNGD